MARLQLQLLFHGAIILFVGLACGLPYGHAIAHGWGDARVRAWQLAHVGLAVGGVALIAIGAALHQLSLGSRARAGLVWLLLASTYIFMIAIFISGLWGGRGLEATGPLSNILVYAGYRLFALGSFISAALFIGGAYNALRSAGAE